MMGVNPRAAGLLSEVELARHPWSFRCDRPGCYYGVCAQTEIDADRERFTHGCPRTGGPMGTGPSILQRMWQTMDALMDGYMAIVDTRDTLVAVGAITPEVADKLRSLADDCRASAQRAHGVCEMIAIVHAPHLADADAVWAEAVARYTARQSGAYHVTPGVSF